MSLILDEHRLLLSDAARVHAFEAALNETVLPHHVVLDLGSGTGILGLLACRAGARHVYSIDDGGIVQIARAIARDNGLRDRITYVKGLSTRVDLPEPADLVVADQLGHFGFEAGLFGYFADARARLLKPGAITIPASVSLSVAPLEAPDMWERIEFWNSAVVGLDLTAAFPIAINTGYPVKLRADQLLGPSTTLAVLDPSQGSKRIAGAVTMTADRDGTLHGIGGWFSAQLTTNVLMTNGPVGDRPIARRNVYFPIGRPVDLHRGDRVCVTMRIAPAELIVTWHVGVTTAHGVTKAEFRHSTWRGMLLCDEDLAKARSDYTPRLSPWGEARRSVLELCDGRSVAAIEAEMRLRHPGLFSAPAEAAQFVSEVLIPYSF
jgi:type I protein arginine methyltransferase